MRSKGGNKRQQVTKPKVRKRFCNFVIEHTDTFCCIYLSYEIVKIYIFLNKGRWHSESVETVVKVTFAKSFPRRLTQRSRAVNKVQVQRKLVSFENFRP